MEEYHKIQTVWLRDPKNKHRTLLEGQWAKEEFEVLQDIQWQFTEKVDGTNIRVMWDGAAVKFGGRTNNAAIPAKLYEALTAMFPAEKCAAVFKGPICIYGEGYGPGIQKGGGHYGPEQTFIAFDMKAGDQWLNRGHFQRLCAELGISYVPVIGQGTLHDALQMTREGFKSLMLPEGIAPEGLIARPLCELKDARGERVITKLKLKDFEKNSEE